MYDIVQLWISSCVHQWILCYGIGVSAFSSRSMACWTALIISRWIVCEFASALEMYVSLQVQYWYIITYAGIFHSKQSFSMHTIYTHAQVHMQLMSNSKRLWLPSIHSQSLDNRGLQQKRHCSLQCVTVTTIISYRAMRETYWGCRYVLLWWHQNIHTGLRARKSITSTLVIPIQVANICCAISAKTSMTCDQSEAIIYNPLKTRVVGCKLVTLLHGLLQLPHQP